MTVRAVVLGLLVSILLASLGYINDVWLFFSYIGGDLVPIHAFGLLLIGLLAINPLLRLLRFWKFRTGEMVVMLGLAMMGSTLGGSAFYWQYPHPMITPIHEHLENPAWREKNLLQYTPPPLMVDAEPGSDVVQQYMQGIDHSDKVLGVEFVSFSRVPWAAWVPTMAFWSTVLSLSFIGGICAIVIVHRQWSKREHLAYPIAAFTEELLRQDDHAVNPVFRNRQFWMGFAMSFIILLINGYNAWDKNFIAVPMTIDCQPLTQLGFFKMLTRVPGGGALLNINIYFAAVGLAYFLSSEASFSVGISGVLFVLAAMPFVERGVNLSGGMLEGSLPSHMWFGAYLGMGIVVLYLGRRFYLAVLGRAFFIPAGKRGDVLPRESMAARILIFVGIAMVYVLYKIGLHPALGIAFVLLSGLLFVMLARIHVATGLFLIQASWHPVSVLAAMFGGIALGPQVVAILALLSTAITIDTRIAATPLVANILKLSDGNKVKPGSMATWMGVAIVVSLVLSLIFTVWLVYDKGVIGMKSRGTTWAKDVAKFPFQMVERTHNDLEAMEMLKEAQEPTTLARMWQKMQWKKYFFHAVGIGVALVLVCSYLRLRFPGWPLHPLMFLVWGQPWMIAYAPSFMLAWLLKSLIMKYGGQKFYHKARPFFVGLVAGELLAAIVWAVVGVVYYKVMGVRGEDFLVRP